jgi:hypothetical protein
MTPAPLGRTGGEDSRFTFAKAGNFSAGGLVDNLRSLQ